MIYKISPHPSLPKRGSIIPPFGKGKYNNFLPLIKGNIIIFPPLEKGGWGDLKVYRKLI